MALNSENMNCIMKNPIYLLIFIFLCTISHAEENWYLILSQAEEKMESQTMSYMAHTIHTSGTNVLEMIKQQRNEDGTVWRIEEMLPAENEKAHVTENAANYIQKTIYTDQGETVLLPKGNKTVGVQLKDENTFKLPLSELYKNLSIYAKDSQNISGKEILHNGIPCWEIVVNCKTESSANKYKHIIRKDNLLTLVYSTFDNNGKLDNKVIYSDFNLSPEFSKDTFAIPKDAKIEKVNSLNDFLQAETSLFLNRDLEEIAEKEQYSRLRARWTSFWRKVKRNPSPYIVGAAVALAGISFGTAAILKRREKKRK